MNLKFASVLIFLSISLCVSSSSDFDVCDVQRKCSLTEDIVYAIGCNKCYLFRNQCIFENDLCQRRTENKPPLKVVSKEKCMKKCPSGCPEYYKPLCAEYNNAYRTFSNQCDFLRTSCQEDKSYMFLNDGQCEQP